MPSFDVVSEVDAQEVDNAVNNANKEIGNRYDFRNTNTRAEWHPKESHITLESNAEGRLAAALDVLQSKAIKRGISIKTLKPHDPKPTGGGGVKQVIEVQQGIPQDTAKQMVKDVKDLKVKVQGAIQGESLRFTGKNRDDLQEVISFLKKQDYDLPLQFVNFRD